MQETNSQIRRARVLIVASHPIVRAGLRAVLDGASFIVVESNEATSPETLDGGELAALAARNDVDLVMIDSEQADGPVARLAVEANQAGCTARLVVYTGETTPSKVRRLLSSGVSGVISRDAAPEVIVHGLHIMLAGERFVSGRIIAGLLSIESHEIVEPQEPDTRYLSLSPREREILTFIVRGATSREIADHFFISHRTVDNHRSRIMRKLGLKGAVELVRYGLRLGMVDVSED